MTISGRLNGDRVRLHNVDHDEVRHKCLCFVLLVLLSERRSWPLPHLGFVQMHSACNSIKASTRNIHMQFLPVSAKFTSV